VVEDELATNTVNLKIFFWIDTTDFRQAALVTRAEVIRSVKEALGQSGYYLPVPADIQELKLYGAEKDFSIRMVKDED
jgi:small conductance mechanosensitive channel